MPMVLLPICFTPASACCCSCCCCSWLLGPGPAPSPRPALCTHTPSYICCIMTLVAAPTCRTISSDVDSRTALRPKSAKQHEQTTEGHPAVLLIFAGIAVSPVRTIISVYVSIYFWYYYLYYCLLWYLLMYSSYTFLYVYCFPGHVEISGSMHLRLVVLSLAYHGARGDSSLSIVMCCRLDHKLLPMLWAGAGRVPPAALESDRTWKAELSACLTQCKGMCVVHAYLPQELTVCSKCVRPFLSFLFQNLVLLQGRVSPAPGV